MPVKLTCQREERERKRPWENEAAGLGGGHSLHNAGRGRTSFLPQLSTAFIRTPSFASAAPALTARLCKTHELPPPRPRAHLFSPKLAASPPLSLLSSPLLSSSSLFPLPGSAQVVSRGQAGERDETAPHVAARAGGPRRGWGLTLSPGFSPPPRQDLEADRYVGTRPPSFLTCPSRARRDRGLCPGWGGGSLLGKGLVLVQEARGIVLVQGGVMLVQGGRRGCAGARGVVLGREGEGQGRLPRGDDTAPCRRRSRAHPAHVTQAARTTSPSMPRNPPSDSTPPRGGGFHLPSCPARRRTPSPVVPQDARTSSPVVPCAAADSMSRRAPRRPSPGTGRGRGASRPVT